MTEILAALADVGSDDRLSIPRDIAEIINSAFLPSNPRKMRTAAPETIMAAEYFKQALQSKATA